MQLNSKKSEFCPFPSVEIFQPTFRADFTHNLKFHTNKKTMRIRTRYTVLAIASIITRCRAFMLDFGWYHSIDSSNVVECRVRTAVFHGGNDRHITTRRCEAYVDDGDSHGIIYDIPHWILQKYHREFNEHKRGFLRIEGARFAHHNSTESLRVARRGGDTHDQILVDVNAKIEISEAPFDNEGARRRAAVVIGESNVLVVRVSTNDGRVALNASSIAARVFGSYGTPASQYKACSMGQKQLLPAVGSGISDGVLELKLNSNIRGVSAGDFENTVNTALATRVASLDAYDHIIYCLPAGSLGESGENDWIAYAYIEWNRAFFNNGACGYLSSLVHELGHNMGLGHSGKDGSSYGDQSGIMGIGYDREYWPLACFNSAKNWQLGWYREKAVELEARSRCGPWKGRLYGFPDYASVPYNGLVLIKIGDVFIQYNKIAAMNRDTQENANMVAFTQSSADLDSQSWFLDGRNSGTFQYESLCVDICGMFLNNGLEYADMVVRNCTHSSICSNYYTPLCSAIPPIQAPTSSPSIRQTTPPSTMPKRTRLPTTMPPIWNSTNMPTTLFPIPSSIPVPETSGPTQTPAPEPTATPPSTTNPVPTPTTLSPTPNATKTPTAILPFSYSTPSPTTRPSTLNPSKFPPTSNPTPVPSIRPPTMNPSKPPTLTHTNLPTILPTQVPTTRPPAWNPSKVLTPLPTTRRTTLNPSKVPTTRPPTLNPTKSPTIRPTPLPTARPLTQNPNLVPATSFTVRNPTLMPTIPTADMICDDNLLGAFPYPGVDGFVRERDCFWLRARPQMWGAVCSRSIAASNLCRETCGKCVDNCFDTTKGFLFQGFERTCLWLSVRLGVIYEVCHLGHEAYTVCPETCGMCDVTPSVKSLEGP